MLLVSIAMTGNRVAASTINPDYWMERLNSLMVSVASLPGKFLERLGM